MTVSALLSGIAVTLNQFVTGLFIVRARSVCVVIGVRTTYGPIKSTFTQDHGSSSDSFAGKCPYFFRCFLNN